MAKAKKKTATKTKNKPAKRSAPKAKAKAKPKAKAKAKPASVKKKKAAVKKAAASNRRVHKRYVAKNLFVTEHSGDYQFVVAAGDISEGGIFLKGRLKTGAGPSEITIPMGAEGSLRIVATPVYDRLTKESCGTGYRFESLSAAEMKSLKSLLRNLN